ncbi:MAG TPA: thiamine pyrophosphate-dependent enzyme [Thermoanaerobaculia bacterium]|nr:thiamine pyrophosphate-dependent enzyme [Thermoanaerobaculia bacterium]
MEAPPQVFVPTAPAAPAGLAARLGAFVAERHPFGVDLALEALEAALEGRPEPPGRDPAALESLRPRLARELAARLDPAAFPELPETTPGVAAARRLARAAEELARDCDGFLHRAAVAASLAPEERREILRGMVLTRAVDNRLKALFTGGEVRWRGRAFQGKGFRSLGQEAIYAAPLRLRRGPAWRGDDGTWRGDVVAPVIRDLGAALAMHPEPEAVRAVLNAQMGKAGPPMEGRDLHIGDFGWGVLPPTAPLAISTATVAGLALAFAREDEAGARRVAVSFLGEGGTSLGEWHEAINLCAARRLPAIFCVENNQTALSTPVPEQSAVRVFADKAAGYGIPGITLDGTDPEAVAAAFAWAAERARAGLGPALIELVCMRMCGHAHHDDMLYLGRDPQPSWDYPPLAEGGYADGALWAYWSARDPIRRYADQLEAEGVIGPGELQRLRDEAAAVVEQEARAVIAAPWPEPESAGRGVYRRGAATEHREPLAERRAPTLPLPALPELEPGRPFAKDGRTFLEAVMLGVGDALAADPRVFVYGEDVGGSYGNAFLLLKPLLAEHGGRIVNSPIAEGGILGVCVGAALAGQRPIGEIQFNDFVASGFNQLVNNAAKIHYRWGAAVPMVVRMPWGGLRSAGPYHSQNTEGWFYRTPGLKIVAPSTPEDARALLAAAVEDPDPVLYYEHIALYRDPRIKQRLPDEAPEPLPLGRAALRRAGSDLAIVSYGAYVHLAQRVAERLAADGIEAAVLDLRSLVPLDRDRLLAVARHCGKVLVVHEDTRTGGLGESLAAIVQEEAFEWLDAPVRIVGALDTPVPYSPPLEEHFLPGEERTERAARLLAAY